MFIMGPHKKAMKDWWASAVGPKKSFRSIFSLVDTYLINFEDLIIAYNDQKLKLYSKRGAIFLLN